ncbi:MAG: DUF4843 domain-containing protein [Prevotella sp.]
MKKAILYSALGSALLLNSACTENKMEPWNDTPAIYFEHSTSIQTDSVNQSFFIYDDDVKTDTVIVRVCAMGGVADYDRPFSLVQTNVGQSDAAVAGTHFEGLDSPEMKKYMVIPAGQVYQDIPFVFLRDKSLALGEYRLELAVEDNEYFRKGIDEWRTFVITTTDQAVKPALWDTSWKYYFGPTWGSVKMKFIIQSTGYTDFDTLPDDYSYRGWLGNTAKQALLEYNTAHPDAPLCEADGTLVTFE